MHLLYNVARLHQFGLGRCVRFYDRLPGVIADQIVADGSDPGGTNYCWLLAPSIASSESIGEIYLGLSETDPQRSWGTLDRMTAFWNMVQGDLTGEQQVTLVKNGALWSTDDEREKPLTIQALYEKMWMVPAAAATVLGPSPDTGAQLNAVEEYLRANGPILLLRPGVWGGHIEVVAGVAKLKDLDDNKIYDCLLVSSTQPREGSEGRFEARPLVDFADYLRNGKLGFYRYGVKPDKIAPFDDLWRTMFIRMDVLPTITRMFKSRRGFAEIP
ncbi:MAG TPA: hypothetical protein VMH86_12830 [Rhizomicrobium sp.]|nr:hypothetical protein [Rhizomicrobium sp.]